MTHSWHVRHDMIRKGSEKDYEDRQTDRNSFCPAAGRESDSTGAC